jgi:hypothetical protein
MSMGLPQYPNPERPDPYEAEESKAVASRQAVLVFFFMNLAAAYAPGLFWVPFLRGIEDRFLVFLFSPVLFGASDAFGGWSVLFLYFLVLVVASISFYQSRLARILVPVSLFAYSVVQGIMFASFVRGLNALGRS